MSFAESALSNGSGSDSPTFEERWGVNGAARVDEDRVQAVDHDRDRDLTIQKWETSEEYQYTGCGDAESWENTSVNVGEEGFGGQQAEVTAGTTTQLVRTRSQYPDLAMIAPSPIPSPLGEFGAPLFMEFAEKRNRRALVDHFCNVLSHLIVFKEDTGNPFRQLVLPLSHASSPVTNAIFALSSAHLEYRGIENAEKSLDFHNKALQGLAQLIEQNDEARREEVLGAIILLVYYEVVSTLLQVWRTKVTGKQLVQRGNSNIVDGHLKGAMTIIKAGPRACTPTSLFLERVGPILHFPFTPIL